jgi:hypothetical protein
MQTENHYFDLDNFVPSNFFKEYHTFENYSPSNSYRKDLFIEDFGKGKLQYRNVKHTIYHSPKKDKEEKIVDEKDFKKVFEDLIKIKDDKSKRRKMQFIVAKEVLTKEERNKLIPCCQCQKCIRWSINPIKYMICECCVGCLKVEEEDLTRQHMINLARDYYGSCSSKVTIAA